MSLVVFHNYVNNELMNTIELERKFAWIYLLNLGFYILPMVLAPYSAAQLTIMTLAMLAFIGVYYRTLYSTPVQRPWLLLALYAIACAMTVWNPGTISMFGFVAFFAGFYYPLRRAAIIAFGIVATLFAFQYVVVTGWEYFHYYGLFLVVVIGLFGVIERNRQQRVLQEKRSEAEIERLATTVERERIARDLHDILGHTLSCIILKADLAEKQLAKQQYDDAGKQLAELATIARESLSDVRKSVSGYKHQGLGGELDKLQQRLQDAGFKTKINGELPTITGQQETTLILALTEMVTNIVRHSTGNQCVIEFSNLSGSIGVALSDNGGCEHLEEGNGLRGVRERMQAIGGQLNYSVSQGCHFELLFPTDGAQQT